ncbi:MAG: DNA-binding protein, partial [Bacteroidales bacterium]|nr:DNA-binding protein [Bacteroidales bacterium]
DGAGKYNWASFGIEVGDEVTVQGPKTTYNGTVELVDVSVVKVSKSLIKVDAVDYGENLDAIPVDGGDVDIMVSCKGSGIDVFIPESAKTWLGVTVIDNSEGLVRLSARSNEGGDLSAVVTFITPDGR